MYDLKYDTLYRDGTDDERRMIILFNQAIVCLWKDQPDGARRLAFDDRFALYNFFREMCRRDDAGYLFGALLFSRRANELDRAVRSHVLTRLSRMHFELSRGSEEFDRPPRESEVSNFGQFVNAIVSDLSDPPVVFEWFEDLNTEDPERGLKLQPTSLIRGILFSNRIDPRRMQRFWQLAAASPRFPDRVFCDPCPPFEGAIFTSYHLRAIARIFASAPAAAVERFAAVIRDRAVERSELETFTDGRRPRVIRVPAHQRDRDMSFASIVGYIDDNDRKQLVARIFRPAAA